MNALTRLTLPSGPCDIYRTDTALLVEAFRLDGWDVTPQDASAAWQNIARLEGFEWSAIHCLETARRAADRIIAVNALVPQ